MKALRKFGFVLAAPALALVIAFALTMLVLLLSGPDPLTAVSKMVSYGLTPRVEALVINTAVTYYIAAIAVAIGFKMNLFNIGVDGQYRLAAMLAASLGGAITLAPVLHSLVIIVAASVLGAAWALVAALLKVYRGVSEVISTIMLNYVATGIVAYLLAPGLLAVAVAGSNNIGTKPIAASGHISGLDLVPGSALKVNGLIVLALAVGIGYWFLISKTRFGFDLRATGANEPAAIASGVNVKRMVLLSMALSGAVAGLVGMPQLLGSSYSYSLDFPAGIGFTGIAIALLGRNHPVGIAFGALLWSFLDNASEILDLYGVPKEIVKITQGVIVLSVVVAYELVRRYRVRAEQRHVGSQIEPSSTGLSPQGVSA